MSSESAGTSCARRERTPFLVGALRVCVACIRWRGLVVALTRREVLLKYRGTILGFLWSFVTPLFLLVIYTCVFGLILKMSWPGGRGGLGEFGIMLFCGLVPFNFYAEALSKASSAIVTSPNYVKRISFPTELLPLSAVLSAFVHAMINTLILALAAVVMLDRASPTLPLVFIVWVPMLLSAAAAALVIAAVGVFLRDVSHAIGIAFSAIFFLSPIIYPSASVPVRWRFLLYINPIAFGAENLRKVLVTGLWPEWRSWLVFTAVSAGLLVVAAGYFECLRRRFADVL